MSESTYEEATRCPKCGQPGDVRLKRPAPAVGRGVQVHQVYCPNQVCPWFDTSWLVQVNADGSIPPPTDHTKEPKVYVGFEGHDQIARDIRAMLETQAGLETRGGGEVRF